MKVKKMKKAAMFGLDARIALAIFGALSVISGAALYGAIQNARAVAIITDMNEFGKALEQYYLDTGQDLSPFDATEFGKDYRITEELVKNPGVTGWKGPYVSYVADDRKLLLYPKAFNINVMNAKDNDWNLWTDDLCDADKKDCYLWVHINRFKENEYKSIIMKIDEILDNSDGGSKGKFRYKLYNELYSIYIKYAPYFF